MVLSSLKTIVVSSIGIRNDTIMTKFEIKGTNYNSSI
jgi:hypothetical protein